MFKKIIKGYLAIGMFIGGTYEFMTAVDEPTKELNDGLIELTMKLKGEKDTLLRRLFYQNMFFISYIINWPSTLIAIIIRVVNNIRFKDK